MKTRKLSRNGIYKVDNVKGGNSYIVKVTGIDPFFTVESAFNLTLFEKTGQVTADIEAAKEIEANPKNYVYTPMEDYSKKHAKIDNQPENIDVPNDLLEHWVRLAERHSEGELIQIITEENYTYAQAEIICNTIRSKVSHEW